MTRDLTQPWARMEGFKGLGDVHNGLGLRGLGVYSVSLRLMVHQGLGFRELLVVEFASYSA